MDNEKSPNAKYKIISDELVKKIGVDKVNR